MRSIRVRRGQRAFRNALLDAYGNRCAITGCDVRDLLEAAHIVPYQGPDTNRPQNGLLLRADLHTLFDCGLIAIEAASMTVVISPKLEGSSYRALGGRKLRTPTKVGAAGDVEWVERTFVSSFGGNGSTRRL
jgi:putative restriction endonuclease